MQLPAPPSLGLIDGIPAHELLEGLGNLHQSVVVTDVNGVVLWASRALERTLGEGRREPLGLERLCAVYLESMHEGIESPLAQPGSKSDDALILRLTRQTKELFKQLEQRRSVCHYQIEPGANDIRETACEINAFAIDSRLESARTEPQKLARLYVVILRPVAKPESHHGSANDKSVFFKGVLDQLPEATLTIDQSGFITYANARTVYLLGRTVAELVDTPVSLYFPTFAILSMSPTSHDETERAARTVVELVPDRGPAIDLEVAIRMLELPDGTQAGRILQLHDTTKHRRVTERFKRKIASLEAYVHTVSHDLRSPLVSMLGFTRLMRQDYGKLLDETGRRFLDRIEQAGTNMNTMTEALLELSTREQPQSIQQPVDPRNILLQIQAEMKPRLEAQGIRLELPSAPPMIQCDRTQLYQIFSNLIGNALMHMGPCATPRIEIEIENHDDGRVIVVRDNGRGIAREEHDQIFDEFHSRSRDGGARSTGVGLAIVKKIALAHGGDAWVASEPGHGAEFFVSLGQR